MTQLLTAATAYVEGGLSVIPVHEKLPAASALPTRWDDKQGRAIPTWKDYQERVPTPNEIREWCENPDVTGIAGVGGSVSGNLCVLDFDVPSFYERWHELVRSDISSLPVPIPTQRTPSGGYQAWFRCPEPGRNQKLAWAYANTASGKPEVAIETRATGGYALLPPSLHPNGGRYKAIEGQFSRVPTLDMDIALNLLDAARSLSEIRPQDVRDDSRPTPSQALRSRLTVSGHILESFNQQYTCVDWLLQYGYTQRGSRMARPNGASASVTLSHDKRLSYHFSSNDPLSNTPKPFHDPFSVYQHLVCGGDFTEAKKSAAKLLGIVYHDYDDLSTPKITTHNQNSPHISNAEATHLDTGAYYMAEYANSQTVVLVEACGGDDPHRAARMLRDMGVSAISGPRNASWPLVWLDRIQGFKRRYVWFQPPLTALVEDLALDANALLVDAEFGVGEFLTDWSGTQTEVLSFLLNAIEPVGRIGARGLLRR